MNDVGAKHPWLFEREGRWYLRARVPKDVPNYPKTEVKRSLNTSNQRDASRLIDAAAAALQHEFEAYRLHGGPPPKPKPAKVNRIPRRATNPVVRLRYNGEGPTPLDLRSSEDLTDTDLRSFAAEAWHDWQGWIVAPPKNSNPEWLYDFISLLEADSYQVREESISGGMFRLRAALFLEQRGYFFDQRGPKGLLLNDYLCRGEIEAYRRKIERLSGLSTRERRDRLFDDIPILTRSKLETSVTNTDRNRVIATSDDRDFLFVLQPWLSVLASRGMKPRQVRQYENDLRSFAAGLIKIRNIRRAELQKYYERSLSNDAPNTISRKFSVIRNYWRYLQANSLVSKDDDPFGGLMLPAKKALTKRKTWTPAEVCSFWHIANARSDEALANAIRIAAFTGGRIEAICSLSLADIFTASDGGLAFRFDDKTDAGIRDVPVHSAIEALVRMLMATASQRQGYLIDAKTKNQHDERSTGVGKRFSRMKIEQGYGKGWDFHSIRRTLIGFLSKAYCPEAIAADIVGHEKPTMTYGLYNDACDIEVKRHWLERSVAYPDQEFMQSRMTTEDHLLER